MRSAIINSDLFRVRNDLKDCQEALGACSADENTYRAIKALMRAVSSLTLAVERLAATIVTTP